MSYALETKKRKFHRVLESLSGGNAQKPSSNADASKTSETAASLSHAMYPTIKKVRLASGSDPDSTLVRRSVSRHTTPSPSPSSHRPNFVPWDRERFLERLETFRRVDRWSPKPPAINEVQWAKRGWSCVDVMRVECVGGCGRAVVVKLPEEADEEEDDTDKIVERKEVQARLVEEYAKRIAEGHSERCPWRKSGCDDTIQRLPLTNPETALSGLRTRYRNLNKLGPKLPAIENIETPTGLELDEIIRILPANILSESTTRTTTSTGNNEDNQVEASSQETPKDINQAAFTLALFGWDAASDVGADLATCGACFRRLGLWMYKPKKDGSISVYSSLNVVSEHMDYCPWINAKTQSGGRKSVVKGPGGEVQSGWEVLGQAIKTIHRRQTRSDAPLVESTPEVPASPAGASVDDDESRKLKDREWWAKLRRVRQTLQVKGSKKAKGSTG
ncbi:hypothetical protein FQN55_009004 [Onygenales sp. PD_40]|nr:hypothetical protein FQN55_009004 [Onygenales sp. PD_40]KAK2781325.1 hypothetical protein FQN52_001695 [Onygenales sp. PD_12]KAK2784175.1 hypothetical protein FQN53_008784 [Emmonsiellopsis sp. PD_33]